MKKRNPLKLMGTLFAAIGIAELIILLGFAVVSPRTDLAKTFVFPLVFGVQGIIFSAIGLSMLKRVRKKAQLREELIAGGYSKNAVVVDTERVYTIRVNGRHPYRVICRVTEGDVLHEYRSEMLHDDPGLIPGDPIQVYLDWQDDTRYYVDVESAAPTIIRH